MTPGFYFGKHKAEKECPGPEYVGGGLTFDFGTNTWRQAGWKRPPGGWGGDNGATWGVYDPVSDALLRYRWDGSWGSNMEGLDLKTGEWEQLRLGATAADRRHDGALRESWAVRSQLALDSRGRAVYFVAPGKRALIRYVIARRSAEVAGTLPPEWRPPTGTDQEVYTVFDPVHRVVIVLSVPNLGGEVLGLAVFDVERGTWEWIPAPTDLLHRVMGNLAVYEEHSGAVVLLGGHKIRSVADGAMLPSPRVFWRFRYAPPGPAPGR
jgi:hypothetical protein